MQKKKRKRRLRVGRLLFLLIILGLIIFLFIKFVDIPLNSISVSGNKILSDQEVIEIAGLNDYPSYTVIVSLIVKNRLEENFYIKHAKVSKGFLNVKIKIEEEKVLYIDKETSQKHSKTDKIKDNKIVCAPFLSNDIPKEKLNDFIKAMNKINKKTLCQMSEIKYDPNEIDSDRYFVYMNDGNGVYLTVNKFKKLNKYNTILENIGKQNGILYLDYGDYFEPY